MRYSIIVYQTFRSLSAVRLVLTSFFLLLWTVIVLGTNLMLVFVPHINSLIIEIMAELSIAFMFLAFAIIAYIQINPIYNRKVRLMGGISFSCFVVLVGFTMSEVIGTHNFIEVVNYENQWIANLDPLFIVGIFSGIFSFAMSYYYSSDFLKQFPEGLLEKQIIHFDKPRIYSLIVIISVLFFIFVLAPLKTAVYMALVLELLVCIHLLVYMYISYRQPFLQIGYGANPYRLLENNYIGYFVGSSLDIGPNIIRTSREFIVKSGISQMSLEALNVGVITLLGINDSFKEEIAIVPVPKFDEYTSIAISFFVENPNVDDTRVKHQAPSVLAIILPSVMVLSLKGFNSVKSHLKKLLLEFNHIDKLDEHNIKSLIAKILYQLIY